MTLNMKKIEQEALQLSPDERAQLAEHLIYSLDEEEDVDAERLWVAEAERRYQDYKNGAVKAKPADEVFNETRSKIK